MEQMGRLVGCQAHSTTFVSTPAERIYSQLRLNLTWDSEYFGQSLFAGA